MKRENGVTLPTVTHEGIYGFFGDYRFLSNFHVCDVLLDGICYSSSEAAFMAQKSVDPAIRLQFASMSPKQARAFGQQILLRPDWDSYRVLAMTRALTAKFSNNIDLASILLATGDLYLEETNYWGDKFWGVSGGEGKNMLGHCLMHIRDMCK